jgi:hypothetical protein
MAELMNEMTDVSEMEAVEKQIEAAPEPEKSVLDELPEKYRGKTIAEIAKWHADEERKASRLGNEVGEVRKLADELIKSQLNRKPEVVSEEVDFFENPHLAVKNAIESNPRVRQAEEYALMAQKQMALQTLAQKHPDYQAVNSDPEFQEWVGKTKIRQNLYQQAQNYDLDAGDELLSTFKELKAGKQRAVSQVETQARDNSLKAAAVETSGTNESSQKKYSRRAIIDMQLRDPRKFESMRDAIDAAYREGRIIP